MKTVLGLIEDDGSSVVQHFVGYFFAPVSRQAVHDHDVRLRLLHQVAINLVGGKNFYSLCMLLLLAHAGPYIGVDNIGIFYRADGIVDNIDDRAAGGGIFPGQASNLGIGHVVRGQQTVTCIPTLAPAYMSEWAMLFPSPT